jgi:hypothetical protein
MLRVPVRRFHPASAGLLAVSRSVGLLPFLLADPLRKERRRNPAESQNPTFMSRTPIGIDFCEVLLYIKGSLLLKP